ncbi:MAG: hypothetical protein ABIO04_11995 [Ferruginibacter sp.]
MRQVLAGLVIIFFASCDTPRYAYSPSAHNVPVLTKQGDSKVAANYSTNADIQESNNQYSRNRSNGYDLQGAVAVTDHIAVQASYFSRKETSYGNSNFNSDSSVVRYKRNMIDFGAGYFTSINKKDKIFFQVFAGAGFGKLKFTDAGRDFNNILYSRFYNSDLIKYYIEPAIIFRNSETFAASLSTRLSVINFKKVSTNYTLDEKRNFRLDSLNRYAIAFFEPAFVNSYGFKGLPGLRIEYQLGLSLALVRDDFINYRPFNFSVGLVFDIPKLIKGTANKSTN